MNIRIEIVPDIASQRYPTSGDYFYEPDGTLVFRITEQVKDEYTTMILIHEMFEELTTRMNGITEQEIMDFDLEFEKNRTEDSGEPGDDPNAPYFKYHVLATKVERMICKAIGISFKKYDNEII
jgi:hypothetical protein